MGKVLRMPDAGETGIEFLRTELRTGLTMARIALEAESRNKVDRNRANARKAYDTALRFIAKTPLTDEEAEEIRAMITRLKLALAELGEEL
jgi:hypothetical protein